MENVLLRNGRQLADFIFQQMMEHYDETLSAKTITKSESRADLCCCSRSPSTSSGTKGPDFRKAVTPASDTPKQVFGGFRKCCYTLQKFESDPERRFAVLIESDPSVQKWIKPGKGQFQVEYRSGDNYEPDFVVETADRMLICEVKAQNELTIRWSSPKRKRRRTGARPLRACQPNRRQAVVVSADPR